MMKCLLRCEQENFSSCMIDTKTVPNKRFRSFIHYIERKCVGAYRIRPSRRRTCPFNDGIMFAANISFPLTSGRMRYAPTPVRLKSGLHWVKIQSQIDRFNHRVIIESNGKYVGAYRIRPPRRRTFQQKSLSQNDASFANAFAAIVSIFAHLEGVCDTPLDFPVTQKQLYSHIMVCAIVLPSKMSSQMGNHHLPGIKGTFAMGNHGLKSEQNTSPTCEMRAFFCTKRLSRLRWR